MCSSGQMQLSVLICPRLNSTSCVGRTSPVGGAEPLYFYMLPPINAVGVVELLWA